MDPLPLAPTSGLITDRVRAAIRAYLDDGHSVADLAFDAGLRHQVVTRFMDGADLKLTTLDKLSKPLNLFLARAQNAERPRRGRRS